MAIHNIPVLEAAYAESVEHRITIEANAINSVDLKIYKVVPPQAGYSSRFYSIVSNDLASSDNYKVTYSKINHKEYQVFVRLDLSRIQDAIDGEYYGVQVLVNDGGTAEIIQREPDFIVQIRNWIDYSGTTAWRAILG